MRRTRRRQCGSLSRICTAPVVRRLGSGALAGAAGWWAMDQTLQFIYDRHSATLRARERRARAGVPALEVLAEKVAAEAGVLLEEGQRKAGGTILQWSTGVATGVIYAALRPRLPARGIARGIGFGAGFSLVVDEGLTPLLGLSPGPFAFPWQTHARGFLGHLVFGIVAEAVLTGWENAEEQPE